MRSPLFSWSLPLLARSAVLALVLALALPLGTAPADARLGGGFSFGSRGTRSFSAPPSTMTAPRSAQPLPQSTTPGSSFGQGVGTPRRGFGFGSGLAAGLLGAGLFGMLTGSGFFGGLGSLASLFGLLVQVALIGGAVLLAFRLFGNRSGTPVFGGRTASSGPGSSFGGFASPFRNSAAPAPAAIPIEIAPGDYTEFERTLGEIQAAHSREDLDDLSRLATPALVGQFRQDIDRNRSRGLRNDVTGVKLLQGDLSEAWRENATDYATVAMRFAARDVLVDRASGRVVEGDPDRSVEATELWTFRRDRNGPWVLSAIQQAA